MTSESNEIIIDDKKLDQMKLKIFKAEHKNLKTREKTNDEMVEYIRKIIKEEVKKNY